MSIRPTLSSFDLRKMRALFGCKDPNVMAAINWRVRKEGLRSQDPTDQLRAREYVETIVTKGKSASYPYSEDEIFQIVVDAFAHHGQEHIQSQSLFWEAFMGAIATKQVTSDDQYLQLALGGLVDGSPMFGGRNGSIWSYYAFLTNEAAVMLPGLISGSPALREAFGVEEALSWLEHVRENGRDVWCWMS